MDLYGFVSWSLVIVAAVTLIWPVNIPLVALAYRVHLGRQPSLMETRELWLRSTLGALGLCGLSLVMIGLIYVGVEIAQVTAGPVQLTLFVAYLAAAVGFLFWVLALEDMVKAHGCLFALHPPARATVAFARPNTRLLAIAPACGALAVAVLLRDYS